MCGYAAVINPYKVARMHGRCPLHRASRRGHAGVARMVIERGAGVSAQDKYGKTPLHLPSQVGHVEVVHMLITHDADVSAQENYGKTPLYLYTAVYAPQ
jgi:ankyrin repeat protein